MVRKAVEEAVSAKNIDYIRGLLCSVLGATDEEFNSFFEGDFEYVLKNGITEDELFQEDDGAEYSTIPTEENLDALAGNLRINFSKKKLEDLKKMGRTIIAQDKKDQEQAAEKKTPPAPETPPKATQSRVTPKKCQAIPVEAGLGAGAGTVIGAGIALTIARAPITLIPVIGWAIAGAAVGATVVAVVKNITKKK